MKSSINNIESSYNYIREIQYAYGEWVDWYIGNDCQPFMMSFMSNRISAVMVESRIFEMNKDIERVYGRLARRFAHKPNSAAERHKLPVMLASPDLPVFKSDTSTQRDLGPNDGLHCHAICLVPPVTRFKHRLDLWVMEHEKQLICDTRLSRIHVERVGETPAKAAQYVFKSLGTALPLDSALILPREIGNGPNPTDKGDDEACRTVQGASLMRTARRSA